MEREKFSSRLGFVLISAGCAIGLGNIWKFPYMVGQYGGAVFVLIYLLFLAILGIPILTMEFSVGRASGKSISRSFYVLQPKNSKWQLFGWIGMIANYILMMFYTTVAGWMFIYFYKTAVGDFNGLNSDEVANEFASMLGNPLLMCGAMLIVVILGMSVCFKGLKNGVEKITKPLMLALLFLLVLLAIRSVTLDGAAAGLSFYLVPNLNIFETVSFNEVIFGALSQAFFTLSIGIGSMAIFGSYIDKNRSLTGEAINVTLIDTFVAFVAGLIIFPACSAFNVDPDVGASLIFITLPNVFNNMPAGQLWGSLFFVFMMFAAMSTVIGVFENIISCSMDLGMSRKKAVLINLGLITVLSVPCALGFNVLSAFAPLGEGSSVLDLEDFLVSFNLLPLGSLVYLLFCVSKYGWGWDNFIKEANTGKGLKFPKALKFYVTWIVPVLILYVFIMGYKDLFFS